jgi:hypothetical protein
MGRAIVDYITKTKEGKRAVLKILGATVKDCSYTKQYYIRGHLGDTTKRLDYSSLTEYRGWLYLDKSAPADAVEVYDKPNLAGCDMCGGLFPAGYCSVGVKKIHNGREYTETACNHCRSNSDDIRVRGTSSHKTCQTCEYRTCRFHPDIQKALQAPATYPQPITPAASAQQGFISL